MGNCCGYAKANGQFSCGQAQAGEMEVVLKNLDDDKQTAGQDEQDKLLNDQDLVQQKEGKEKSYQKIQVTQENNSASKENKATSNEETANSTNDQTLEQQLSGTNDEQLSNQLKIQVNNEQRRAVSSSPSVGRNKDATSDDQQKPKQQKGVQIDQEIISLDQLQQELQKTRKPQNQEDDDDQMSRKTVGGRPKSAIKQSQYSDVKTIGYADNDTNTIGGKQKKVHWNESVLKKTKSLRLKKNR